MNLRVTNLPLGGVQNLDLGAGLAGSDRLLCDKGEGVHYPVHVRIVGEDENDLVRVLERRYGVVHRGRAVVYGSDGNDHGGGIRSLLPVRDGVSERVGTHVVQRRTVGLSGNRIEYGRSTKNIVRYSVKVEKMSSCRKRSINATKRTCR